MVCIVSYNVRAICHDVRSRTMTQMVTFDFTKLVALKKAYEECEGESFMFDGREYLKAYAKYLIQYLEGRLKK